MSPPTTSGVTTFVFAFAFAAASLAFAFCCGVSSSTGAAPVLSIDDVTLASLIATSLGVPDAISLAISICSFINIVLVATEIIYIDC